MLRGRLTYVEAKFFSACITARTNIGQTQTEIDGLLAGFEKAKVSYDMLDSFLWATVSGVTQGVVP